jgi:Cu-Zn family superoxide dismutase
MRFAVALVTVFASGVVLYGQPQASPPTSDRNDPRAIADLKNEEGRTIGKAALRETPNGVLITMEVSTLLAGPHALHIHTTGRCEPPAFESAGGHFSPRANQHGSIYLLADRLEIVQK